MVGQAVVKAEYRCCMAVLSTDCRERGSVGLSTGLGALPGCLASIEATLTLGTCHIGLGCAKRVRPVGYADCCSAHPTRRCVVLRVDTQPGRGPSAMCVCGQCFAHGCLSACQLICFGRSRGITRLSA